MTTKAKLKSSTSISAPPLATAETIADLNTRYLAADGSELLSEHQKLLVVIEGRRLIAALGGPSEITLLTAQAGITGNFTDPYSEGAQLITGFIVAAVTDKRKKKRFRNLVSRAAKLMLALDNAEALGEHIGATDPQIADWVEGQDDGWTGVIRKFATAASDDDGADDDDGENVIDLDAYRRALEISAIKLPIPNNEEAGGAINAALPAISVHQRSGDNLLVLPLSLPADLIEQLRPYLPAADAKTPEVVRFWGHVATLCQLFDRADSGVALRSDMERHEGEAKAPSRPIIRVLKNGDLSIAASRVTAGMVVEASASMELGLDAVLFNEFHINGTGTNVLLTKLTGPSQRGSYESAFLDVKDGKYWLKFGSRVTDVKDFRVRFLPIDQFGSSRPQWTLGVREEFDPQANATVTMTDGVIPSALVTFAGKVSGSKHPVVVKIAGGKLSLALGKSASWDLACEGGGDAEANVASGDFARVFEIAENVSAVGCAFSIDATGLVAIRFATAVGDFTVHIPALLDGGARSPALLDRIEKPRAALAPTPGAN